MTAHALLQEAELRPARSSGQAPPAGAVSGATLRGATRSEARLLTLGGGASARAPPPVDPPARDLEGVGPTSNLQRGRLGVELPKNKGDFGTSGCHSNGVLARAFNFS